MQGSFLLTTRKKSKTPLQNVSGSDGHIRVITYTIAIILKSLRKQNISALAICFKKFSFKRKEKLKVRCQSLTVLCQKRRVCYNHCYDCVFFFPETNSKSSWNCFSEANRDVYLQDGSLKTRQ